jgi:hypothetical protein
MRHLLWTVLLAAPLLAQEAEEKEPAKQDNAAEIRKLVESLLDSKDAKELRKLEERLRRLLQGEDFKVEFIPTTRKEIVVYTSPQETISGSTDGTSYTLKSLGGGKYKLTATRKLGEKETRQITDEGTLKELRKKYDFLKGMLGIGVPVRSVAVESYRKEPVRRLGMQVRAPSDSLSHHLELPTGAGLVVGAVARGSRAEKLGLKEHDVLLRIDGELIDSPDQLKKLEENEGVLEYVRRAKVRKLDLSKITGEK